MIDYQPSWLLLTIPTTLVVLGFTQRRRGKEDACKQLTQRSGRMETWLIVTLVVIVLAGVVVAAFVLPRARRKNEDRKRTQAGEHMREAQLRSTQAEKERAAAEEQAARARRERAEAEEAAARREEEAQAGFARAEGERAEAERLQQRAEKLAPDLRPDDGRDQNR